MSANPADAVAACLGGIDRELARVLGACLDGRELSWQDAVSLQSARGRELLALCVVADELRLRQAGDEVTYVVNRNINFTNVCVKTCQFCAFSRDLRSEEGYLLDPAEIVRRALEAQAVGATEICLQAGLPPTLRGRLYIDLCETLTREAPGLHLHAFSPEEVKYGATRARMSIHDYLAALRDAGLGSLPGTSAEILDDALRQRIAPGRISTAEWVEVIRTAHALGLPTTSTMMFGHVETVEQRMRHMDLLRSIQKETGGFTEFVPLSFVHHEAPMFVKATQPGVSPGPTGDDVIRLYATARLMLGATFRNIQASWVKEGARVAQWLLSCGVNDLGGTLINESISTSAGAGHGQLMTPATLRRLIRDAGRTPAQRNTRYEILRRFDGAAELDPVEPLDGVTDPEAFGSYRALVADPRFRYRDESRPE
ncbi:MAG: 5-amino-6-(D-ribitylamino)uracil--L-tyrosine 4-hydroxyphenyl transferase CofH [Deltaproteobacteria bacterium]|nr:5-amino-6-(D-ribitylamino)uracil--L-tyrosine 4-hydroxyphenyl transferase CofH [Deltaproteobacteria bacterium]MCB9786092.1 5-amino-6-(D-ribitylamino)uracil--L-tyrosine 4-hydroxyphenyl transferase CofH [Deltaproteobacteria bacterium]